MLRKPMSYRAGYFWLPNSLLTASGLAHGEEIAVMKFSRDKKSKGLYTPNPWLARGLSRLADESAKTKLNRLFIQVDESTPCEPIYDFLHGELEPLQKEAVKFAIARNRSYLAADPGVGKGAIAASIISTLPYPFTIVLCPPGLCTNLEKELSNWCLSPISRMPKDWANTKFPSGQVVIVPDTLLQRQAIQSWIKRRAERAGKSLLIVDEAHRFKGVESKRSLALSGQKGIWRFFDKIVLMSGTPIPNRPWDLYPILKRYAPEAINFMQKTEYGIRYCAGKLIVNEHGSEWDFKGASNTEELFANMKKTFMYRLRKSDIIKNKKTLTEEMVFLTQGRASIKVKRLDRKLLKEFSKEDLLKKELKSRSLGQYQKRLGILKVPDAVHFLEKELKDSKDHFIVFAHHKRVISDLTALLARYKPLVVTGDTPKKDRDLIVRKFQKGKHRLVLGNIQALGTGFTLTKANRVIFVEWDWTPGQNKQAGDRMDRIGQTRDMRVQYLVFKNSLDRAKLESNLKKRNVINQL